jgi:hypothetical protein
MQSFASTFPRESEVVEMKFFGGLARLEFCQGLALPGVEHRVAKN